MIYSIKIYDLSETTSLSYKETLHNAWISVVDYEDERKISRIKNNFLKLNESFKFFSQFFYDWSDEDSDLYILKNLELVGPRKSQIQNIITFLKEEVVNSPIPYNLGINCYAGVSRSTAIGIIAWKLQNLPTNECYENILKVRPQAWPNLRILRFADEILGTDLNKYIKNIKDLKKSFLYY